MVSHRLDDKIYAVKRVQFEDFSEEKKNQIHREVNNLAKLDSEFVVKYYNSWLESNHLFIQMQFCLQSLKSVLKDKPIVFGRQPEDQMNVFEYFISCEIFKEILECVQYLHQSVPAVIHRDLKPDNIVIKHNIKSNRFIKLCDFGLAVDHNITESTSSRCEHSIVGTRKYMAPEVYSGIYSQKADIYSLHVIGQELFGIDVQDSQSSETNEHFLKLPLKCMYRTLVAMMSTPISSDRPECREVLAKHNEWSIDKSVVINHQEFNSK
ncbi:unnamed protein product [Medioppia subpectinata]|uniref:non-specific serine/threonine protein kinase n=1 Tax=Medioppia subpectinata TaxID=1979941 RepID=A0A7R9KEJ8_9ACAR|nr:unnamed protein product [Medioppia subpectinata]CAG2100880.1 unnamed protein product [Medioppia subpectinata]